MTCIVRYYISGTRVTCGETYWNGKEFTRMIDECKVYIRKAAAQKQLAKLMKNGYFDIKLNESRYTI